MSDEQKSLVFESIEQVVQNVDLARIITYELHGVRREADEGEPEESPQLEAAFRVLEDLSAEVRLRMRLLTRQASLFADISAIYSCAGHFDESRPDIVNDFVGRVGAMAVIPYLREAIMTTASRLGVEAPLLGIIRQGDLTLGEPDPEGTGFEHARSDES